MLQVIEHGDTRVLTTAQLAKSLDTESKIINQNYRRNKNIFKQGIHFFALTGEELKEFKAKLQNEASLKFASTLYLWTEKGAWLHANSLNTDQAKNAIVALIDDYYTKKKMNNPKAEALTISYEQFQQIERRVELLEQLVKESTLHSGEQARIRKAVGARVYELTENQGARQILFRALYAAIKERYNVGSYRDIKQYQLQDALRFIEKWKG